MCRKLRPTRLLFFLPLPSPLLARLGAGRGIDACGRGGGADGIGCAPLGHIDTRIHTYIRKSTTHRLKRFVFFCVRLLFVVFVSFCDNIVVVVVVENWYPWYLCFCFSLVFVFLLLGMWMVPDTTAVVGDGLCLTALVFVERSGVGVPKPTWVLLRGGQG